MANKLADSCCVSFAQQDQANQPHFSSIITLCLPNPFAPLNPFLLSSIFLVERLFREMSDSVSLLVASSFHHVQEDIM